MHLEGRQEEKLSNDFKNKVGVGNRAKINELACIFEVRIFPTENP